MVELVLDPPGGLPWYGQMDGYAAIAASGDPLGTHYAATNGFTRSSFAPR
jgi:hypothetical protein